MRPRHRLMGLAGTVAAMVCLTGPVLAQGGTDEGFGGAVLLPTFGYAVPGTFGAKDEAGSGEQKVPRPAPSGCPFNDSKLELIV
jgi:hypothetical protein